MVDPVAVGSLVTSVAAIVFAALTWLESRKLRHLLGTVMKSLPFVARRRRTPTKPKVPAPTDATKAAAEERRRLKLELEREKHEWRKNRDIAKAVGWFLDRMDEDDDQSDE